MHASTSNVSRLETPYKTTRHNPQIHHRRSIRVSGHDYGQDAAYFVTLCTWHQLPYLGTVSSGQIHVSSTGQEVDTYWRSLPDEVAGIRHDEHRPGLHVRRWPDTPGAALAGLIARFKSTTSTRLLQKRKALGFPRAGHGLWQRNYYEHIIRDQEELDVIRRYIAENPARWEDDRLFRASNTIRGQGR